MRTFTFKNNVYNSCQKNAITNKKKNYQWDATIGILAALQVSSALLMKKSSIRTDTMSSVLKASSTFILASAREDFSDLTRFCFYFHSWGLRTLFFDLTSYSINGIQHLYTFVVWWFPLNYPKFWLGEFNYFYI